MPVPSLSRRSLLGGLGLTVVGGIAGYLVAQGSDVADAKPAAAGANGYGPPKSGTGGGQVLTSVGSLAAGGGVIVDGVVVTQDTGGAVHAFSATCTHQGCTVASVAQGRITCPCHGSMFDAATGAVVRGPATRPLPAVPVSVRGQQVVRP